jgi:hypothetical protein
VLLIFVALAVGLTILASVCGPELAARLGPVEEVVGKLRQELFVGRFTSGSGTPWLFCGRVRLLWMR